MCACVFVCVCVCVHVCVCVIVIKMVAKNMWLLEDSSNMASCERLHMFLTSYYKVECCSLSIQSKCGSLSGIQDQNHHKTHSMGSPHG